ncbi:HET-domain-containing protein [Rhypophila decipiens]|uniref:HET-domain-containing protein n=1 Tax=Rhypophila decipiens TaxID=261697 RepID=A0AAN6YGJ3_9PEZI|nr:HET-domain-containing protein [Rhypophila decipiens]
MQLRVGCSFPCRRRLDFYSFAKVVDYHSICLPWTPVPSSCIFLGVIFLHKPLPQSTVTLLLPLAHPVRNPAQDFSTCLCNGDRSLPWEAIKARSSVCGDPLSPQLVQWVSSRVENCVARHSFCQAERKIGNTSFFPKRILRLDATASDQVTVQLVEEELPGGRYAALSHCWGTSLKCTTTTANLSSHKERVPWKEMPLTFQEAILFCLRLGICYLWIDALCILQDDQSDWQIQSAQMADIYQRSYVTLSATGSKSGSAGCFPKPSLPPERQIEVQGPGGQSYCVMVRSKIVHWANPLPNPSRDIFPLLLRGWAFQERILTPRVLRFCKSELVWECNEEVICECGSLPSMDGVKNKSSRISSQARTMSLSEIRVAERIAREPTRPSTSRTVGEPSSRNRDRIDLRDNRRPLIVISSTHRRADRVPPTRTRAASPLTGARMPNLEELTELRTTGSLLAEQRRALEEWHKIVEQYSGLQLSRETDRLPALSGLVNRTAPFLGRYFAGLWSHTFLKNLAWRVDLLTSDSRRPAKYQGPSWSWVSVNTRPVFECVAKPAGQNPFGEVSSAALVAKGLLRTATLTEAHTILANGTTVPLTYQARINLPIASAKNAPQGSVEMPFYADYALTRHDARQYRTSLESTIYLFLIHPNVCLVLDVAGKVASTKIYNRIGILKQLYIYPEMYEIDWMKGATLETVTIV